MLVEKYLIPEEDAMVLVNFLEPMLLLDTTKRATAREMLRSDWIQGIRVAGEEELEALRQRGQSPEKGEEALKPVGPSMTES